LGFAGGGEVTAVAIQVEQLRAKQCGKLSISFPGPMLPFSCSVVPEAHVGNTITFDLSAASFPKVR
jgi:hypothetical protein